MTQEQSIRYARHTMLPEVGEAGQVKLLKSKVLCLGAGGLGSPAGLYLAAAGVGTIGFVDDDVVDASNLQRQIIHATDRVGMPKVESAAIAIAKLNPDVKVIGHQTRLDVEQRARHHQGLRPHRRRRRQLPDALPAQRRGAEAGQAGRPRPHLPVRGPGDRRSSRSRACYRCLVPRAAAAGHGAVVQGGGRARRAVRRDRLLQATEAIKLILGIGKPLSGRLLLYDALNMKFREFKLPPRSRSARPAARASSPRRSSSSTTKRSATSAREPRGRGGGSGDMTSRNYV